VTGTPVLADDGLLGVDGEFFAEGELRGTAISTGSLIAFGIFLMSFFHPPMDFFFNLFFSANS
jgi:hypothetical protein